MDCVLEVMYPAPSVSDGLPEAVEVRIARAAQLGEALQRATDLVSRVAVQRRMGILMTRVGPGRYIVQTYPDVPFGLTRHRFI